VITIQVDTIELVNVQTAPVRRLPAIFSDTIKGFVLVTADTGQEIETADTNEDIQVNQ
jgi:hypothetical protein